MKDNIHPKNYKVVYLDTASGAMFISETTSRPAEGSETVEIEGVEYQVIKVETSSASHPFYTGTQKAANKGGQIERLLKKVKLAEEKKAATDSGKNSK